MWIRGRLLILGCAGLLMVSCSSKAKKSREVQAAIERMDREHEQQLLKQKEERSGLPVPKDTGPPEDGIAARVNEKVIFYSDIDESVREMLRLMGAGSADSLGPGELQQARKVALQQLIQKILLEQEAVKRGITVSDEEVEQALQQHLQQRGISKEQFYIELASTKMSLERFKDKLRRELIVFRLLERDIARHVQVTDAQVQAYYEAHRDKYVKPGRVRIQQIVLITRGTLPQDKREKHRQINEIRERILAGEDFGEVARAFSQGPNAEKGGDCGFFKQGELLEELDRAAFSLKVGEVSPVIETSVGFHILKALEKEPGKTEPVESVRAEIKNTLGNDLYKEEIRKLVETLQKSAHIDVRM